MDEDYSWVAAAPFRALLTRLSELSGLPVPELAGRARIPSRLAERLVTGRNGRPLARIPPECARRLLALDEGQLCRNRRW